MEINVVNKSKYNLPKYETSGASGFDLIANINEPIILHSLDRALIKTGLFFQIPEGYELQVRPRSGLALKNGISICNTPGTVDADYRGEVGIILINLSKDDYIVNPGDRIAQAVIANTIQCELIEVKELNETERGSGGFGHTGI